MLCEQCKVRKANFVIREFADGKVKERKLCSKCITDADLSDMLGGFGSLAEVMSAVLGLKDSKPGVRTPEEELQKEKNRERRIRCSGCGMSYGEFVNGGKFGCPECYDSFGVLAYNDINMLQGSNTHTGKKPSFIKIRNNKYSNSKLSENNESMREQLIIFKAKQDEAVKNEDYDKAAYYRDEIKKIKERMSSVNEVV